MFATRQRHLAAYNMLSLLPTAAYQVLVSSEARSRAQLRPKQPSTALNLPMEAPQVAQNLQTSREMQQAHDPAPYPLGKVALQVAQATDSLVLYPVVL